MSKISNKNIIIDFAKHKAKEMICKSKYKTTVEDNEKKKKNKKICRKNM